LASTDYRSCRPYAPQNGNYFLSCPEDPLKKSLRHSPSTSYRSASTTFTKSWRRMSKADCATLYQMNLARKFT
jgi:hypothetical protein